MYGWKCISIYGLNEIKFIFEFHSGFFFSIRRLSIMSPNHSLIRQQLTNLRYVLKYSVKGFKTQHQTVSLDCGKFLFAFKITGICKCSHFLLKLGYFRYIFLKFPLMRLKKKSPIILWFSLYPYNYEKVKALLNKRPKPEINTSILADNLRKGRPLVSLSSVILSSTYFQL